MLLPIGIAYDFTPYNWGLVALFQQNLLAFYHLSNKSSGYVGLALRHPTICLPIPSINWLNSACFLMDNIFISTQRRISNFSNSKSSRNVSRYALFILLYWLDIYFLPIVYCLASYLAPRYAYTLVENLWCNQKSSTRAYTHP